MHGLLLHMHLEIIQCILEIAYAVMHNVTTLIINTKHENTAVKQVGI